MVARICYSIYSFGFQIEIPTTGPTKSVDFLDITLNLNKDCYAPYRKPLNKPVFIHKSSNHPEIIKNEIPQNLEKRLSNNSSNKENFDKAIPPFLEALKKGEYQNIKLEFQSNKKSKKTKKSNNKKVFTVKKYARNDSDALKFLQNVLKF